MKGSCGIIINSLHEKDHGYWTCHMVIKKHHGIFLNVTRKASIDVKRKENYGKTRPNFLFFRVCTIRTSDEVLVLGVEPESNLMVVL